MALFREETREKLEHLTRLIDRGQGGAANEERPPILGTMADFEKEEKKLSQESYRSQRVSIVYNIYFGLLILPDSLGSCESFQYLLSFMRNRINK